MEINYILFYCLPKVYTKNSQLFIWSSGRTNFIIKIFSKEFPIILKNDVIKNKHFKKKKPLQKFSIIYLKKKKRMFKNIFSQIFFLKKKNLNFYY